MFRAQQARERQGLELKQQRDLEKFTAYQQQEKQRFDAHLQQELEAFTHQQHWRLNAWKQAVANSPGGQKPPPPPWDMPRGGQMPPRGWNGGSTALDSPSRTGTPALLSLPGMVSCRGAPFLRCTGQGTLMHAIFERSGLPVVSCGLPRRQSF